MKYLEAPNYEESEFYVDNKKSSVFLAGSISNSANWQEYVIDELKNKDFSGVVVNPRREFYDINNINEARIQIEWEWEHLKFCNNIIFWFSKETVAPITLFELGKYFKKSLVIGVDPEYPRSNDIQVQMELEKQDHKIVWDLDSVVNKILELN